MKNLLLAAACCALAAGSAVEAGHGGAGCGVAPTCAAYAEPACGAGLGCGSHESCGEDWSCGVAPMSCGASVVQEACCCCDCGPTWQIRGNWLYWEREHGVNAPIVVSAGGATVLGTDDLSFNDASGFEVAAIGPTPFGCRAELRYFQLDGFSATDANRAGVATDTLTGVTFGDPGSIDSRYRSRLYNAEINLLGSRWNDWLSFGAGFRYVRVDESLGLDITFPVTTATSSVDTENDLYGGQIAAMVDVWDTECYVPVTVTGVAKAGLYGVNADSRFQLDNGVTADVRDSDSSLAFVGELGIITNVQLTEHISLNGGYHLLWVDGVAVAGEQFSTSAGGGGGATAINYGDLFYHGLSLGLEVGW